VRVVKMRGMKFTGGYHDFMLDTGGLTVFPRLVAADHHKDHVTAPVSTGSEAFDTLLGGGLIPGTNTLFIGPSGIGKTTTAVRCMVAALERGEKATYYLFDEGLGTLLARSTALGMDLRPHVDNGQLNLKQIDPAELSPGEFACAVRSAIELHGSTFIIVDSLNAYLQAMPGEQFLILQMHELLSFLNQLGVTTILILGQHGLLGDVRTDIDLSYLSDVLVSYRFFESKGELRSALAVVKSRVGQHERSIREFTLGPKGLQVGDALRDFEGLFTGLPAYSGRVPLLARPEVPGGKSGD
jgi:circadian clock protein KaiC